VGLFSCFWDFFFLRHALPALFSLFFIGGPGSFSQKDHPFGGSGRTPFS